MHNSTLVISDAYQVRFSSFLVYKTKYVKNTHNLISKVSSSLFDDTMNLEQQ
jgi:hypothetical protein